MMSDKSISMMTSSFCHYCFMCNIFCEIWLFFVLIIIIKLLGTNYMIFSPALMYFINSCSWSSLQQQSLLITRTRVHHSFVSSLGGLLSIPGNILTSLNKPIYVVWLTRVTTRSQLWLLYIQHEIVSTCPCLLCDKKQQKFSDRLTVCSGCTPPLTRWLNPFSHNPEQKKSTC